MRISRPGITYLNPYVDTSDPTQKSYGNTDLSTEKTHNISLVYNYFAPKITLNATLRYTLSPDGISQYSFYDTDNILNTTYGNIVENNTLGLNAFAMYMPWKQTRIVLNGSVGYSDISSDVLDQSNNGWTKTVLLGLQQTIPFDIRLSANLIMAGNSISLQGENDGMSAITLGLSRSFLDNKLSISLTGMTATSGLKLKLKSNTAGDGFTSNRTMTVPVGQILASITWSFGNNRTTSAKKARRVDIEDNQLNSKSMGESMGTMMTAN